MFDYYILAVAIIMTYLAAMFKANGLYNITIKTLCAFMSLWSAVLIAKIWL